MREVGVGRYECRCSRCDGDGDGEGVRRYLLRAIDRSDSKGACLSCFRSRLAFQYKLLAALLACTFHCKFLD